MRQAVMKPAAGVQVKAGMRTRSEKTHVSLEAKDVVLRWGISAGSHGGVNPVRIVMKAFSAQLNVPCACFPFGTVRTDRQLLIGHGKHERRSEKTHRAVAG